VSLRRPRLFAALRTSIARAHKQPGFRVLEFSVQSNHAHFIVEASDEILLARGMQGLAIRLAQTYNRLYARRGSVWAERYHAHALRSPREMRNALVYVLANVAQYRPHVAGTIDESSSAPWFGGFLRPPIVGPVAGLPSPVQKPTTWLARSGWRRLGLIDPDETPRAARARWPA
jgi:REP element-mobilizing transposase RayT